ncbi:hypothetical protein CEXT_157391 [Caerostris extrusa]|uniref:Uncharacterized protein n=1 Tax=Caerostris extrusa TaxID=172846 RepID=A0AAV4NHJ2_CAEEX|nr:hypothetical protein CEXT_157391 [Caerostris extrusa]
MYKVSLLTLWAITIALILTSVVYGQDDAAATPAEGGAAEGGAAAAEVLGLMYVPNNPSRRMKEELWFREGVLELNFPFM